MPIRLGTVADEGRQAGAGDLMGERSTAEGERGIVSATPMQLAAAFSFKMEILEVPEEGDASVKKPPRAGSRGWDKKFCQSGRVGQRHTHPPRRPAAQWARASD